ncbi:MAG: methionyl-tRNA formyltransferase [Desulfovibrio sp.]|jgi:methionyl-tRNA formyltransferase|nr:methionyl-tRNA formyltransferase [Desulfovibrio sp.]
MAEPRKYRLIFMGTPDFGARVLRRVARCSFCEVAAVYTRPDRPSGRGHRLVPSSVKELANYCGFPVFQPSSLASPDEQLHFATLRPDFLLVASYGLILPAAILAIPRFPPLNVHASLLPRYRGAAPVQRAIMENWQPDARTGVSIMRVDVKLDAGPVYAAQSVPIAGRTAGELLDLLADEGASLLLRVMRKMLAGDVAPVPQDETLVTYAAKLFKHESVVDWNRPAAAVHAHIRAMTPKPGARAVFRFCAQDRADSASPEQEYSFRLFPGNPLASPAEQTPGTLRHVKEGLLVACADCWYELLQVRPHGASTMHVRDFVNGRLRDQPPGFCGSAVRPLA